MISNFKTQIPQHKISLNKQINIFLERVQRQNKLIQNNTISLQKIRKNIIQNSVSKIFTVKRSKTAQSLQIKNNDKELNKNSKNYQSQIFIMQQNLCASTISKTKSGGIQYKHLTDKLALINQKVQEIRSSLRLIKFQKQQIIRQKQQQRQKWKQQRYEKISNLQIERQKNNKYLKIKTTHDNQSKLSILQKHELQTQNQILNSVITQVAEPIQFHQFHQDPYSLRNDIYYISQMIRAYKDQKSLVKQHLVQSLNFLNHLKLSRMPLHSQIEKRNVKLCQKQQYINKKVLIFDLDQTLIHCDKRAGKQYQHKILFRFESINVEAGVNIRPYAKEMLKKLHKDFEIMIFTASQACYADQVLKLLDPQNQYIQHRLYRHHCYLSPEGVYIKDLRIINRPLSNIILVDNAFCSYYFQLSNGIPIIPYYQGVQDFELKALQKYLLKLVQERDVRLLNQETFKLKKYRQYLLRDPNKLVQQLYI